MGQARGGDDIAPMLFAIFSGDAQPGFIVMGDWFAFQRLFDLGFDRDQPSRGFVDPQPQTAGADLEA